MSRKTMSVALLAIMLGLFVMACSPSPVTPTAIPAQSNAVQQPASSSGAAQTNSTDKAWQDIVAAARKEGKVTIYSYSMVGDVGLAVSRAFTQRYGISVDIVSGRGAEMAERIKTEQLRKDVVADLMDANPTQLLNIKGTGGTVSSKDIPVLQDKSAWQVDPLIADPDGHILEHTLLTYTLFVNTKLVPPSDEPKSIAELAGPKWKGKVVAMDPTFSSGVYIVLGTLLRKKYIDENTIQAIGKNGMVLAPNAQMSASMVARGESAVELGNAVITYAPMIKEGAPVKAIAVQEGTIVSGNAIAAIKGGPHPNAAKVFLNWLLSQEGQTVFIKAQSLSSLRNDVPDFRPAAAQAKPYRLIPLGAQDEADNAQLFKDQVLTKIWKN